MTLKELNDKYYFLFNDLDEAAPALPERHYDAVTKLLEQEYFQDVEVYLTEKMLDVGVRNFELKFRARHYLPRRVFLFWNKIAKALLSDLKEEFDLFLEELKQNKKAEHEPKQAVKTDELSKEAETTALTPVNNTAVDTVNKE